jgi:hypothetical protein
MEKDGGIEKYNSVRGKNYTKTYPSKKAKLMYEG